MKGHEPLPPSDVGERVRRCFRSLVCGIPRARRSTKLMALFDYKVFADESGNDPNRSHFVQAGYLSTVERWDALTEAWATCLSEWNLNDGFHMTEAEALDHDYASWDKDVMKARVLRLAQLVESHTMLGVACDVKWADWRQIADLAHRTQVKKLAKLSVNPYLASLHFFVDGVARKCEDEGIAPKDVQVVLADKGKVFRREDAAVARLFEGFGFQKPHIKFAAELAPLQASDMLAWCMFQARSNPKTYLPTPERHRPLVKRVFVHHITAEDLRMPIFLAEFRILSPEEAASAKPVGTLTPENIQGLTFYVEDDDAPEVV